MITPLHSDSTPICGGTICEQYRQRWRLDCPSIVTIFISSRRSRLSAGGWALRRYEKQRSPHWIVTVHRVRGGQTPPQNVAFAALTSIFCWGHTGNFARFSFLPPREPRLSRRGIRETDGQNNLQSAVFAPPPIYGGIGDRSHPHRWRLDLHAEMIHTGHVPVGCWHAKQTGEALSDSLVFVCMTRRENSSRKLFCPSVSPSSARLRAALEAI